MTEFLTTLHRSLSPLWEMSLTAAYAAAIVALLRLVLKKRAPKQVLCLLWLVVFARLLIPLSLESPLSIVPDAQQVQLAQELPSKLAGDGQTASTQGQPPAQNHEPAQGQTPAQNPGNVTPVTNDPGVPTLTAPEGVSPSVPQQDGQTGFPWQAVLAGVWLAGAAAMALYGLVSYLRLRRRLFDAIQAKDGVWEHPAVASPFILGVFRPKIYLPAGMHGQPRRFILCHERAHLRRRDHIVKPVCWAALAIHWFNPMVWLAFLLMSRDMEAACDEAVLRRLGSEVKADYSETLLSLATNGRLPAPCPLAFDEGDAKGRIKNVLNYRRPALWIVVVSAVMAVMAAVCLLTDPVAAREPEGDPEPEPEESSVLTMPLGTAKTIPGYEPWMREVLDGERTFRDFYREHNSGDSPDFTIHQLRSFYYGDDQNLDTVVELGKLAVIDLDKDGIYEMVIYPEGDYEYLYSVVGYLVLRRQGDTVYGYNPSWRTMGDLKADGTFDWSGSAFNWGTGSMQFTENGFEVHDITWCDNNVDDENYFVNGKKATQEEFEAATDAHFKKPDVAWYTYTDGVLAPYFPNDLELLGQTDPTSDTGEAKLWLEDPDIPWLEWNGSTTQLNGLIIPSQFGYILCRDFDGDGQDEVVIAWFIDGFSKLDLYEWSGGRPALADSYDTQRLLVRFNQNNVAAYNKDTRKLTVTYTHTEGDKDGEDYYRHLVTGSRTLPDGFFEGFESIRDGYTYAYAYDFRWFYPNTLDNGTTEFFADIAFCLADEAMKDLDYVDVPPETESSPFSEYYTGHHYMAYRPVGIAHFDLRYDGTQWRVREADTLNMEYPDKIEPVDLINAAAPLSAPLVSSSNDLPADPNQWYKVAELPDDLIWVYSRNYGQETLMRWDGNLWKVYDHVAHTPHCDMPQLKKLGDASHFGPLAVISEVNSGSGCFGQELVVYDDGMEDYTHDWTALAEDFNKNHTFQFDNDTRVMTLTYRGQTVTKTLTYELSGVTYELLDDHDHDRIEQEGCSLSITGEQVYYSFDENTDGDFQLRLGAQFLIGGHFAGSLFPVDVTWTLHFNGHGFDVVPGSCVVT